MFAEHDKHYPSWSRQTSLVTAVKNITKPVTKINFGPSTLMYGIFIPAILLLSLYCRGKDTCYSYDPWNDVNADVNCLPKPDETMTWSPSSGTNPNNNGEGWKVVCK